jgi:hypothetical protein
MKRPERLFHQLVAAPRQPEVDKRKEQFAALNEFIRQRGGWMTSVPGDPDMRFQTLIGSPLPDALRAAGYDVTETGQTQRILPQAIVEELVILPDGSAAPPIENSSRPVTRPRDACRDYDRHGV